MTRITGVDVSSYQSPTYPTSGLAFSIVKATEGTGYDNPNYAAQVACARAGGLVVGHYHYLDGTDAPAEFTHFAAVAKVGAGDIVALDWEATAATAAARDAWLSAAQTAYPHNRVILYCDVEFWDSEDPTHSAADGLWIADYNGGTEPGITWAWRFWQYSSANGMDHSYGNFETLGALVDWCLELVPTTPAQIEDEIMAKSDSGTAYVSWAAGTKSVLQVNVQGEPNLVLDIELKFATGPWYTASSGNGGPFTVAKGSDIWRVPADLVAGCRGAILTWHSGSAQAEYDVLAWV